MSNQEIFEVLSQNECALRYASWADKENLELQAAYKAAKQALVAFAESTGCHN